MNLSYEERWAELETRLHGAVPALRTLSRQNGYELEVARLRGKAEGVKYAISQMEEIARVNAPNA